MQRTVLLCLGVLAVVSQGHAVSKIGEELTEKLKYSAELDVIVLMKGGNRAPLQAAKFSRNMATLEARASTVSNLLQIHAKESQASLLSFLSLQDDDLEYKSFWINNAVFIRRASPELIKTISIREDVESVQFNTKVELIDSTEMTEEQNHAARDAEIQWNVARVQAPEVWAAGFNGTGVRVGIVDTGTKGTHEALASSYLGSHGWYDPIDNSTFPQDLNFHGTHVMGIITGSNGIGVAPGAKWLSCMALSAREGTVSEVINCGQWFVCPTLPDGVSSPDCNKTPHIVSNSWGYPPEWEHEAFYHEVIDAWHAIGIIPVFSQGNDGPNCTAGRLPGVQGDVIAVGSTTINNTLSWFSSRGPSLFNNSYFIKPDISAPGEDIYSAFIKDDQSYILMSGTSMSAPHAAGVIALLFSVKQDLTYDELLEVLYPHATTDVEPMGDNCDGSGDDEWPNNSYGHGLINAWNSYKALTSLKLNKN